MSDDLALVLTGGGARAAYQVGILSGIAERVPDDFSFPVITGVSAGAINAGGIASSRESFRTTVDRLEQAWSGMSVASVLEPGVVALLRSGFRWAGMLATGAAVKARGVFDTRPLRRTLSSHIGTEGIEANLASGRLRAVALSATSYANRRTVTFTHSAGGADRWERAGRVSVPTRIGVEHVMASSALPLLFPAVAIGAEHFGDGSIRQLSPLAPAVHMGARRLLAIGLRHEFAPGEPRTQLPASPPPAQMLGMLMNALFLDALDADAERLERINRSLATRDPASGHPDGLNKLDLLVIRPSQDLGRLASGLAHHLPRSLRIVMRGLGSSELESPDMLSYLLFERPYIERLLELGRADAASEWPRIEPLLAGEA